MGITIISGTNRPGNLSIGIARNYAEQLQALGQAPALMDLQALPHDIAFGDLYGKRSDAFAPFQQLVHDTHHFVFVIPEYNGSIPGILKLFIDACEYPNSFLGKSASMIGISAGTRGNEAGLRHLTDILEYLGVEVMPIQIGISKVREQVDRQGKLIGGELSLQLEAQAKAMVHGLSS